MICLFGINIKLTVTFYKWIISDFLMFLLLEMIQALGPLSSRTWCLPIIHGSFQQV